MDDYKGKSLAIAKMFEGRVVEDEKRVQVCIKGSVFGFPATLEAIRVGYPFGVNYYLETKLVDDPSRAASDVALKLIVTPRIVRGFFSSIIRIFLLEPKGQKVDVPKLDSAFICSFNEDEKARRLARYPGVQENLLDLAKITQFSELLIRTDAGLHLAQPKSFNNLDLDVCKEAFQILGELGQIVSESFAGE